MHNLRCRNSLVAVMMAISTWLASEASLADERSEAIALPAAFQFRGARSLEGTLVNLPSIDALIKGTKLSIPIIIVKRVDFAENGQDCAVTLINDSRINCEILNHQFELVTEWGEILTDRSKIASIRLPRPKPAPAPQPTPASQPAPDDEASLERQLESTTWNLSTP